MKVSQLAHALNVDVRRIQQLVNEGMPKQGRGEYDGAKCMLWYIRYLQAAIKRRAIPMEGDELISEREQRVRKMRIDADLRDIELAKQRGQIVSIADVEREMSDMALTVKARIMAVPPRVAPDLLGETSRVMVQAKLEKALKEALRELASRGKA